MKKGVQIAQSVLKDGWEAVDWDPLAFYDVMAEEEGDEPALLMFRARQEGEDFGYVFFHRFLQEVGVGNTFVTTALTPSGVHMLTKLVDRGVLAQGPLTGSWAYPCRYKVVKDPMENLRDYVDEALSGPMRADARSSFSCRGPGVG